MAKQNFKSIQHLLMDLLIGKSIEVWKETDSKFSDYFRYSLSFSEGLEKTEVEIVGLVVKDTKDYTIKIEVSDKGAFGQIHRVKLSDCLAFVD